MGDYPFAFFYILIVKKPLASCLLNHWFPKVSIFKSVPLLTLGTSPLAVWGGRGGVRSRPFPDHCNRDHPRQLLRCCLPGAPTLLSGQASDCRQGGVPAVSVCGHLNHRLSGLQPGGLNVIVGVELLPNLAPNQVPLAL